jgi:hypothetical protein
VVAKLVAAAFLLIGIAGIARPADAATAKSGLFGIVRKGPVTPVCSVDRPCDAPARATLVFSRRGRSTRVRSGQDGRYRIALPPGIYEVRSVERIGIRNLPRPHAVHVRAGHWDHIDFFFDTGIR